jgi:branched-chain amino acid transport system ATP-binding protein
LERKSLTSQRPNFTVKDLVASYKTLVAVCNVSLAVRGGSRVGIFGHNGSGKSTFLKCLIGGVKTVSGTVHFGEALIRPDFVHVNVRLGISLVPQSRNVFPSLTVERCLRIAGLRVNNRAFEQVYEVLPLLKERRRQRSGLMSGGEQQMVAIGMALMTRPKALLLDEPTAGLSPVAARNVLDCLRAINEQMGSTIIIVEQNILTTLAMVERAVVLRSGEVVFDGNSSDLARKEDLWSRF